LIQTIRTKQNFNKKRDDYVASHTRSLQLTQQHLFGDFRFAMMRTCRKFPTVSVCFFLILMLLLLTTSARLHSINPFTGQRYLARTGKSGSNMNHIYRILEHDIDGPTDEISSHHDDEGNVPFHNDPSADGSPSNDAPYDDDPFNGHATAPHNDYFVVPSNDDPSTDGEDVPHNEGGGGRIIQR
jgi:hypothetical protein